MDNEGSERPPKGGDQKKKALAEFWLCRYIVEEKLSINDLSLIDPIAFSLWLLRKTTPSRGQKRNIFTAVKKYLGKKLLPIHGMKPEFSDEINPSKETYLSTLRNISELSNIENDELRNILWFSKCAFIYTSITGISIAELLRSEVCNVNELDKKKDTYQCYDFTVKIAPSDSLKKKSNPSCKHIQLKDVPFVYLDGLKIFIQKMNLIIPVDEHAKFISKVQYIIAKNNTAKGCSLRQLRSMYAGIHGYIKSDS